MNSSTFSHFHSDLISHKYSNIPKEWRKCFKEIESFQLQQRSSIRRSASASNMVEENRRAATAPTSVHFNRFVRWLISQNSLDDGQTPMT